MLVLGCGAFALSLLWPVLLKQDGAPKEVPERLLVDKRVSWACMLVRRRGIGPALAFLWVGELHCR